MSIVIAYKYAANPQDASVDGGGKVDWSRAKSAVSEYDPVAITVGRKLADESGSEVVGISVGGAQVASSLAKKAALSRGLDRALVVADDQTDGWNATVTAAALAELAKKVEGADLVITGDSSIDDGARMMSALIAGYLKWPCFQEVMQVEKTSDGYQITQAVVGGTRAVSVNGPVVVAVATDAVQVKAASMKEVLSAGKKPLDQVVIPDLVLPDVALAVTEISKPPAKQRKHEMFTGDDSAVKLVAALKGDGLL